MSCGVLCACIPYFISDQPSRYEAVTENGPESEHNDLRAGLIGSDLDKSHTFRLIPAIQFGAMVAVGQAAEDNEKMPFDPRTILTEDRLSCWWREHGQQLYHLMHLRNRRTRGPTQARRAMWKAPNRETHGLRDQPANQPCTRCRPRAYSIR